MLPGLWHITFTPLSHGDLTKISDAPVLKEDIRRSGEVLAAIERLLQELVNESSDSLHVHDGIYSPHDVTAYCHAQRAKIVEQQKRLFWIETPL